MSDFIENLEKVNEEFLPITKHHCSKMDEHFDELFSVFNKHFTGDQPLKCIVPVFFEIKDWDNWHLSDFSYLYYFGCVSNPRLNKAFSLQSSVSAILPGFTKTALDNLNKRLSGRRTVRITTKEATQDCESQCQLEHNRIGNLEEFRICSTCLKNLKSKYKIKGIKSISRSKQGTLVLDKIELNERNVKKQFTRDVNLTGKNSFARAMALPVMHHSLYISDNLDLYYFFSNTVIDIVKNGRSKKKDMGLGGMFVLVEKSSISDENKNSFIRLFERITDKLANRIIHQYRMEEMMRQARKAAISQVFARNGSHNIGSHVLAKMVTKENAQKNFSWGDNEDDKKYKPVENLTRVDAYTALANFNSYLRDRMDFLADLSTGTPQMEVSKPLLTDVVAGLDGNRILMNYISGVSTFEYELQFRDCLNCDHDGECNSPSDCDPITVESDKDISVSMPNDVMGNQAFYIIIENIIRNTSKYGGDNNGNRKLFTINIRNCEADETLYQVCIYDSYRKKKSLIEKEKKEFKDITTKDADSETKKIHLIVARQNANINRPILDPTTNELRHGAWGILEMKVASAYLQKIPVETIDELQYKVSQSDSRQFYTEYDGKKVPNIIKAVNKNGCLGYVFHLMKPKEVLVVDEVGDLYDNLHNETGKLEQLKNQGVWVFNTKKDSEDFFQNDKTYPHPLMLVITKNGFDKNKYLIHEGLYRGNLPTRILVKGEAPAEWETCRWVAWTGEENLAENICKTPTANQKGGLIHSCWRIWLKNKLDFLGLTGKFDSCEKDGFTPDVVYGKSFYLNVLDMDNGDRPDCNSLEFNFGLDHHGSSIHKVYKFSTFIFEHYEGYPSAVKPFLKKSKNHVLENSLLIDGILTNILIIDERVQAIYQEKFKPEKEDEFDNNQIRMRGANIHIPDVNGNSNAAIDLNQEYYGSKVEDKIKKCIDKVVEKSTLKKGLDFIVIHLGVIEKALMGANKVKSDKEVKDFIKRIVEKSGARVVITSGRGKPDNLPAEVAFLSYSTLSHYAIETPFKAYLNQVLQSARTF